MTSWKACIALWVGKSLLPKACPGDSNAERSRGALWAGRVSSFPFSSITQKHTNNQRQHSLKFRIKLESLSGMCVRKPVNRNVCIYTPKIKYILDYIYEDYPRVKQFTDFIKLIHSTLRGLGLHKPALHSLPREDISSPNKNYPV